MVLGQVAGDDVDDLKALMQLERDHLVSRLLLLYLLDIVLGRAEFLDALGQGG